MHAYAHMVDKVRDISSLTDQEKGRRVVEMMRGIMKHSS